MEEDTTLKFPISKELLDCFNPRGPYYVYISELSKEYGTDNLKIHREERMKKLDSILEKHYTIDVCKAHAALREFRNFVTHTFDDVTENVLRRLVRCVHLIQTAHKDKETIAALSKIEKAVDNQLSLIPDNLKDKQILAAKRERLEIQLPSEAVVSELKELFREEIKGKIFEFLDGRYAGTKGVFNSWNGTNFMYYIEGDTEFLCKGSVRRRIKIFW